MIQVTENIWVGNSDDERHGDLEELGITAVLNVAHDLSTTVELDKDIECMHVGLVDGPGNTCGAYCAAVLALDTLLERHDCVLVFCHDGHSRSLAVAVMYVILDTGRVGEYSGDMNRWRTWDAVLAEVRYQDGEDFPNPHEAHKTAVDSMPFGILEQLR